MTQPLSIQPAVVSRTSATTAQLIASSGLGTGRALPSPVRIDRHLRRRGIALGFALHHLTEPLGSAVSMLEMHRATTMLTKQLLGALEPVDPRQFRRLLTDPDRTAMPDGRTAREFCGGHWDHVAEMSRRRADDARTGVEMFGSDVVATLAILRGVDAVVPWWSTPAWDRCAEAWFARHDFRTRLLSNLKQRPESVDDSIVADVLNGALGDGPRPVVAASLVG